VTRRFCDIYIDICDIHVTGIQSGQVQSSLSIVDCRFLSGLDIRGGAQVPPIIQTKHKHTFKLR